jgi:predicted transcriptional regulator
MEVEEFFAKYANVPLEKRFVILSRINEPYTTLQTIWVALSELEEKMRPMRIERDKLLESAEQGFKLLEVK